MDRRRTGRAVQLLRAREAVFFAAAALAGAGSHIVASSALYGGSHNLLHYTLARFGISPTYFDPLIGAGIERLFKPNTRAVFLESPGSLTFEIQDVPAIADFVLEIHDTHHPLGPSLYYEDQRAPARKRTEEFWKSRVPKYLGYFEDLVAAMTKLGVPKDKQDALLGVLGPMKPQVVGQ